MSNEHKIMCDHRYIHGHCIICGNGTLFRKPLKIVNNGYANIDGVIVPLKGMSIALSKAKQKIYQLWFKKEISIYIDDYSQLIISRPHKKAYDLFIAPTNNKDEKKLLYHGRFKKINRTINKMMVVVLFMDMLGGRENGYHI